jgi:hypothetical protein
MSDQSSRLLPIPGRRANPESLTELLNASNIQITMSREGNRWDNVDLRVV